METTKLDPLYSIDKAGKIRVFECEYSYTAVPYPEGMIISKTGLVGGKLTPKIDRLKVGKQKRDVQQQTAFQAKSLWNGKRFEGYKSKQDIVNHSISENVPIQIMRGSLDDLPPKRLFEMMSIKFNTNPDWFPLCMLAEKWKDKKKNVKYPLLVQPKLNGVRCTTFFDKDKGIIRHMSRGGQYYVIPHITDVLKPFFKEYPNAILDGEIYNHGTPLQTISGAVRTEDEEQLQMFDNKQEFLEYWIYDCHSFDRMSGAYKQSDRRNDVINYVSYIHNSMVGSTSKIVLVNSYTAEDEATVMKLHDSFIENGFEGAITRDPNADYAFSFRDKCLLKVKQFEDAEFIIMGSAMQIDEPETFVFILKNDIDSQTFKARPTGTLEQKAEWHSNITDYLGKKATVRFQERSSGGLPIQAHVRHKDTPVLIENIRKDHE